MRRRSIAPSAYWEEELANFEYMLDASPLIIDKLRHHTHHITGLRVYDYRTDRDRPRERSIEKLRALLAHGKQELLVPESAALRRLRLQHRRRAATTSTP